MSISQARIDETLERLREILERNGEALVADSVRILNFETVSGGDEEQERRYREQVPACFAWLEELAGRMGFSFRRWDFEVAEIEWRAPGDAPRPVMGIATHVDVVTPAGDWSHPPFAGDIDDGVLYGRGTQDDKGPLVQALHGLYAVKEAGITPPCDIRVIVGTREETGDWTDMDRYVRERGAPDYSFTPDADFPLIIGEKGMCNLRFHAQWPKPEPHPETGMEFDSLEGGQRLNIIPALAEVRLRFPLEAKHEVMKELVRETTRYTVENTGANVTLVPNDDKESAAGGTYEALVSFLGRAAHSSQPEKGHNALADALQFFCDIETLPRDVYSFIQFLAMLAVDSDGSALRVESAHDFVGATSAPLTLARITATGGEGTLNVRPTMGMPCATVLENAKTFAKAFGEHSGLEIKVDVETTLYDAIYLDPELPGVGPFLDSLMGAYAAVTGREAECVSIGGTTYAKALPNCCAFGPVLPGVDEGLAHQADERMAIDSIKRNALIYGLAVALLATGDEP